MADDGCPYCGEVISDLDRAVLHDAGLDIERLDCPNQDLEAIVEKERGTADRSQRHAIRHGRW
ncbi:MAG: hypothetical protein QOE65_2985 [Solirubrobacteraceae bacterium]|jgi:hypothetical protein|nr:hypothetical protein [Solirubrobacteraceae bacterium]